MSALVQKDRPFEAALIPELGKALRDPRNAGGADLHGKRLFRARALLTAERYQEDTEEVVQSAL